MTTHENCEGYFFRREKSMCFKTGLMCLIICFTLQVQGSKGKCELKCTVHTLLQLGDGEGTEREREN